MNLQLMLEIDRQYLETPFYGVEKMCACLNRMGYKVNVKRIRRLMRLMGLEAIYPRPNTSKPDKAHKVYPYLLRGLTIGAVNEVWSIDITYIPMEKGFMYLVAIMDWYSRYILSWDISNMLENRFCIDALQTALEKYDHPRIFNTDQGSQFTATTFTDVLQQHQINISMDSKGRATDNVFIERLWRSLKYEYVYPSMPRTAQELYQGVKQYVEFYNQKRPHASLDYKTPYEVYCLKEKNIR